MGDSDFAQADILAPAQPGLEGPKLEASANLPQSMVATMDPGSMPMTATITPGADPTFPASLVATAAPAAAAWRPSQLGAANRRPGARASLLRPPLHPAVIIRPGTVIAGTRYRVERWLGAGGMGVVYEATHVALERRVAVKVLHDRFSHSAASLTAFRQEAKVVSRIGSNNIVDIFDFVDLADGRLVYAMDLLRGTTLADAATGPMEPGRVIAILRQLCRGLHCAHQAGVIHRDIKPENIFLCAGDGRRDGVKILDFGISVIRDDPGEQGDGAMAMAGSPHYIAPETIAAQPATCAVDVYGLGCVAYRMLTGQTPFTGTTLIEVLRAHLETVPPALSQVHPGIPAELERVVMTCLAKDPSTRYANMAELEAAICEAQIAARLHTDWDDLPVPVDIDPQRRERLIASMPNLTRSRLIRRHRWAAAGLALFVSAAVGLGTYALSRREPAATVVNEIEHAAAEARAAAAQAYYVYPPPYDPSLPTAYLITADLEQRSEAAAQAQAQQLRDEFATTLVRLGDEFWDRDHGRSFAVGYYKQALVFDPGRTHAQERAELTPEAIAALEQAASRTAFSSDELLAASSQMILALSDPKARAREAAKVGALRRQRARELTEQLGALLPDEAEQLAQVAGHTDDASGSRRTRADEFGGGSGGQDTQSPRDEAAADESGGSGDRDAALATPANSDGTGGDDATGENRALSRPSSPASSLKRAQEAVAQGQAARRSGNLIQARRWFQRALADDRRNVAALAGLRDVAFNSGDYSEAVHMGEKVVKLAPKSAQHRLRLGDAYFKVLRYYEARSEYQAAAKLGDRRSEARLKTISHKLGE